MILYHFYLTKQFYALNKYAVQKKKKIARTYTANINKYF